MEVDSAANYRGLAVHPGGSADEMEGFSAANYRGPAIRKGAPGPSMLHMFLSFSVVSLLVDLQTNQVTLQLKVSLPDLA